MQRVLAIAWLTWKAAFRFRLFIVVAVLLLASVVGLPLLLKDDGTAQGFTQILLTYTLSVITALLGLSTLWLACGTLARDIEECQMQMVVVKPVARWQVWLGKWLGLVSLNAALLALSGACVFGLLNWRASKLPEKEQHVLRSQVLVSRGTARPELPLAEIQAEADRQVRERQAKGDLDNADIATVRRMKFEEVKAAFQNVPPGRPIFWQVKLGASAARSLKDVPLHLRFKFNAASASQSGTFEGHWEIGVPGTERVRSLPPMSLAPDTFHEVEIPPNLFDEQGVMTIVFGNFNDTTLVFSAEEGIEVLFRQGGFLSNYIRALLIILCWMGLLASVGLAASSFLSFPVASLASMALLVLAFSTTTLTSVVAEGTVMGYNEETGETGSSIIDTVAVPVFRVLLNLIQFAKDFAPIDAVSTGRSIPWGTVGMAGFQIVLVLGGVSALLGMFLFTRRELATAQGNQ